MNNRTSTAKNEQINPTVNHRIDMLCLAITYIGLFSCLVRADYNLLVAIFCYFVWQTSKQLIALRLILFAICATFLFDLIFIFTQVHLWGTSIPANPIWDSLHSLHVFGIFCFVLIQVLKLVLLWNIGQGIKEKVRPNQTN